MKKLHLSITIKAPIEKVWETTIGKDTYPLWTEVFYPGSNIDGSWKKGSKVHFIGPNENGKNDGMVSEIAEVRKPEFISLKHIGFLKNGVEDTTSPEVKAWTPSFENYTLKYTGGKTEFTVDMDTTDDFYDYFQQTWPKSLAKLKEVAETGTSSTISTITWVKAPIEKVWEYYTSPEHIIKWAFASDDWEAPHAENDVKVGGRFKTIMAAKDKSAQFDFTGTYTQVKPNELIEYTIDGDDKRHVSVAFSKTETSVQIIVTFDMEHENTRELQQNGWQGILNNFKKHVESS